MHSFKTLDPEAIQKILEATDEKGNKLYPDVLTPLAAQEERSARNSPCPKCGAYSAAFALNTRRPFVPSSPLPNNILRCMICATEFDPKTGLILFATLIDGEG